MSSNLAEVVERLARIEALLGVIASALPAREPLLDALAETFGQSPFSTADVLDRGASQARKAAAMGQRPPSLPAALTAAKADTPRRLGAWLGARVGRGITCVGRERGGAVWAVDCVLKESQELT